VATSATASERADRRTPPFSECQRIARLVAADHPTATHQLVVRTGSWADTTATFEVARRVGSGTTTSWVCDEPMIARIGRAGFRPLADRRSGDGTTPAGVFPLATMTAWDGQRFSFFGNSPDPGVRGGAYRRVRTGDCFGATPNTPGYGHLRNQPNCPGPDDEYLPSFVGSYAHAALIGANMEPDVSGDEPGEIPYAAAIFLHRHAYVTGSSGPTKPTAGCVSLPLADLVAVLREMPADTLFVMGPTSTLLESAN
jgi:L,D-peptidoglycan transpeptidase YkuD (ErfK/YbiS/YcfS/YnhG family)